MPGPNHNILLVVLDSVRAKNCSAYGHHEPTTPFLSEFAATEATKFEHAKASGANSITSHASMFSGLSVEEHGVKSASTKLKPENHVFSHLSERGYATGVFTDNVWLTRVDVGLKDGFEEIVGAQNLPYPDALNPSEFVSVHGPGAYKEFLTAAFNAEHSGKSLVNGVVTKLRSDFSAYLPEAGESGTPAQVYVDKFLRWSRAQETPWAACINLMDAHVPYEPSEDYDRWDDGTARSLQAAMSHATWDFHGGDKPWWQRKAIESVYDGGIAQGDAAVQNLVKALRARGEMDDTLLIVTSDHGEGFGEPSRIDRSVRVAGHNVSSHEMLLHVPLIVQAPGQRTAKTSRVPISLSSIASIIGAAKPRSQIESICQSPGRVVSTAVGLDSAGQSRAQNYVEDLSPWTQDTRVVYDWDESTQTVTKHASHATEAVSVVCRDAQTQYVVARGEEPRDSVAEAFDSIVPDHSVSSGAGLAELNKTTRDTLERLGYI